AAVGKPRDHVHQLHAEELALVDADDLGIAGVARDGGGVAGAVGGEAILGVGDEVRGVVAVVDDVLEGDDAAAIALSGAEPGDEPLGLAAEHATANDFDPAGTLLQHAGLHAVCGNYAGGREVWEASGPDRTTCRRGEQPHVAWWVAYDPPYKARHAPA